MNDNKHEVLAAVPASATLQRDIVTPEGNINARALVRTLGAIIGEVLTGELQASRASTAIRAARTMVALADACRRSSDVAQPLLRSGTQAVLPENAQDDRIQ
jgi:hypothetical protein